MEIDDLYGIETLFTEKCKAVDWKKA